MATEGWNGKEESKIQRVYNELWEMVNSDDVNVRTETWKNSSMVL